MESAYGILPKIHFGIVKNGAGAAAAAAAHRPILKRKKKSCAHLRKAVVRSRTEQNVAHETLNGTLPF